MPLMSLLGKFLDNDVKDNDTVAGRGEEEA